MDYSLTSLFVVPVGNTLPTAGSTGQLTNGQFGIFQGDTYAVATAANVATTKFIQFAQGQSAVNLGSKKSDKIDKAKVKEFYKTVGHGSQVEIWELSNFNVPVTDDVILTLLGHSKYLDGLYGGFGFRKSYTVAAGCLACGDDPCTTVPNEDVIDAFIALYNADVANGGNPANIPAFFTFEKVGTGAAAVLRITAKPYQEDGNACDLSVNPFDFDRMWFRPVVTLGADTTADFELDENCPVAATATLIQKSTYSSGSAAEIAQLEKDFATYQSPFKSLYSDPGFNPFFQSFVDGATTYNTYTIIFDQYKPEREWTSYVKEDETAIIAVPAGSATDTALTTILTAFYAAPEDKTATAAADYDITFP